MAGHEVFISRDTDGNEYIGELPTDPMTLEKPFDTLYPGDSLGSVDGGRPGMPALDNTSYPGHEQSDNYRQGYVPGNIQEGEQQ